MQSFQATEQKNGVGKAPYLYGMIHLGCSKSNDSPPPNLPRRQGRLGGGSLIGVNVNSIAPGFIASSRTKSYWEKAGNDLTDQIALRRVGQPEEAAKVIEFLVTDLSDYVTGQCIPICGGYVAWG